jgi:hypothetical protein
MYLRVPEGSIWRLPSEQVGGALLGRKIARRNALCTWDVKHIGHSDPADLDLDLDVR